MTGRERILAALHWQPVDRLPWSPVIDDYFLRSLPPGVAADKYALCRLIGSDIFDWPVQGRTLRWPHCKFDVRHDGENVHTTIDTPAGPLTERRTVTSATTFIAEPKIKSPTPPASSSWRRRADAWRACRP